MQVVHVRIDQEYGTDLLDLAEDSPAAVAGVGAVAAVAAAVLAPGGRSAAAGRKRRRVVAAGRCLAIPCVQGRMPASARTPA